MKNLEILSAKNIKSGNAVGSNYFQVEVRFKIADLSLLQAFSDKHEVFAFSPVDGKLLKEKVVIHGIGKIDMEDDVYVYGEYVFDNNITRTVWAEICDIKESTKDDPETCRYFVRCLETLRSFWH